MFNAFVPTCVVDFHKTHGQNKTRKFDNEGFVPVASLIVLVGSPSSFIKYLIIVPIKNIIMYTLTKNESKLPKLAHVP